MICDGDGSADPYAAVDFRGFVLERRRDDADPARAAAGGRDGGLLVRVRARGRGWPTARRGRLGLRRRGRTGDGESPGGRRAPPTSMAA